MTPMLLLDFDKIVQVLQLILVDMFQLLLVKTNKQNIENILRNSTILLRV